MKIKIENWGPVKEFEYDLDKSLIVTYGTNNIGKSYSMQVVYLLIRDMIIHSERVRMKAYWKITKLYEAVKQFVISFQEEKMIFWILLKQYPDLRAKYYLLSL